MFGRKWGIRYTNKLAKPPPPDPSTLTPEQSQRNTKKQETQMSEQLVSEIRALRQDLAKYHRERPDRSITWGVVKGLFVYQFIFVIFAGVIWVLIAILFLGGLAAAGSAISNPNKPAPSTYPQPIQKTR